MTSNHEPLMFRRRVGYARVDEEDYYKKEHTEETVKDLISQGITIARTHFYKGFGLVAEAEEIANTIKFTKLCHKNGIIVQGYLQFGTFQYETMYLEEPESKGWACKDKNGLNITLGYAPQFFRYKPCLNNASYINYLKKVIKKGIQEVGLDMIGFDNVGISMEPEACTCDACKEKYVEFVKNKYRLDTEKGRKLAKEVFGYDNLECILPPAWNKWNMPIDLYKITDPSTQEWVNFKCETLNNAVKELCAYAKSLKKNIILEWNVYPSWGFNSMYWNGIDMAEIGKYIDGFYNEHDPYPKIDKNGIIISMIRSFKLARAMGNFVVPNNSHESDRHLKISIGEALAFNQGDCGRFGSPLKTGITPEARKYIAFREEHADIYSGTKSAAKVALLESCYSLSYNRVDPYYSNVAVMQTLLSAQIPFDIVLDRHLSDLSDYSVLILPDVECLSDEQGEKILKFVKAGGKLLFTEKTGEFNEWYRKRKEGLFASFTEKASKYGKGEIVYMKEIKHKIPYSYKPEEWYINPRYWELPLNHKELADNINKLLGRDRALEVKAPAGCIIELLEKEGKQILHVLNFNLDKDLKNVDIKINAGKKGKLTVISPDEKCKNASVKKQGGKLQFKLDKVHIYKVCVIE